MNKICWDPIFMVGLTARLLLIVCMVPSVATEWYVPFIDTSTSMLTADPWSTWINSGGDPVAFPYGYAMWLAFLPMTLLVKLIGLPMLFAYYSTLLVADIFFLMALRSLIPDRQRFLLLAYWLSPIIILVSYGLGLNDLIPALLLCLSMVFIQKVNLKVAGIFLALAVSAKLSMVAAVPFFMIYLFNNRSLRSRLNVFLSGFAISIFLLWLPFLFSEDGIHMLFGNPEMGKVFQLTIGLTDDVSIYVVPVLYFAMLYLVWRLRRMNFELFNANIGMAFLLIVLIVPASPGWFVWCFPFLVLHQALSGRMAILSVGVFSATYVVSTLVVTELNFANGSVFSLGEVLRASGYFGSQTIFLLHSVMVAIGIVLGIRIWRESVIRNDFFRLTRNPFVLGVAGDSGAGKDTFADAVIGLFGQHSAVKLSGDDYHLWDRQKPIWQVITHLNPMANNLEGFCKDLVSLTDGRKILTRHYDHETGRMSKPFRIESKGFIVASGLHALYLPIQRDCYDLKIFLDIDENLRRHFKLKRDVKQRGHRVEQVISSLKKREADSQRFIYPQHRYADLILSLHPIHPRMLDDINDTNPLRLKLIVETANTLNELSIHRVLVGVCGLHVDITDGRLENHIKMTIEGEVSAADCDVAAKLLCPQILDFLDIQPKWLDGMIGLMQLITLCHISQALLKRVLK